MAFHSRESFARRKKTPTVYWRVPVLFYVCVFCVSEGHRLGQIWFDCGEGSGLCVPEGASGDTSANFLRLSARLWRFSDCSPVHPTHHHLHHPEKPTRLPSSKHQQLLKSDALKVQRRYLLLCVFFLGHVVRSVRYFELCHLSGQWSCPLPTKQPVKTDALLYLVNVQ